MKVERDFFTESLASFQSPHRLSLRDLGLAALSSRIHQKYQIDSMMTSPDGIRRIKADAVVGCRAKARSVADWMAAPKGQGRLLASSTAGLEQPTEPDSPKALA
jgi:hypothetical protein